MRTLIILLLSAGLAGCIQRPDRQTSAAPRPGEKEFKSANLKLTGQSRGTHHGNSEEATEMARVYSAMIGDLQPEFFSGGKENRIISLTDEKFLTYCRSNDSSVVFLVHVPQFKRYKGDVRDTLLLLAWMVAEKVTENHPQADNLDLVVGLRGSLMYGGSAIGKRDSEPTYENEFSIGESKFYRYFAESSTPTDLTAVQSGEN